MATTTTNLKITKPASNDSGWGVTLNADLDILDGLAPIGGLFASTAESPSATLNIRVTAGSFRQGNGQVGTYAGSSSFAMTASITNYVWLTDSGTLTKGTAWPVGLHVRIATVIAGATTITSVTDARLSCAVAGASNVIASQTVTSAYTVVPTDGQIRCDATGGAFTVTLPAANTVPGLVARITKIDNVATVTIGSTSNINGSATTTLTTQYQAKTFVADGTSNLWNVY